jgi:hypothetical protein
LADAYAKVQGDEVPIIVEKRPRCGAADAYVTMDLRGFVDLIDAVAERAAELARDER